MSYIESKLDSLIITVPDTGGDRFNVVVIFGGLHYATPAWMQARTPQEIMEKTLVVFAPYTVEYPTVIKSLAGFLGAQKLRGTGLAGSSVMGFSRGGINALNAYTATHRFVGLIDPSFHRSHVKRSYSGNVAMLYGSSGMLGLFGADNYAALAKAIRNGGGFAERQPLGHAEFPKVFMEKFKSRVM